MTNDELPVSDTDRSGAAAPIPVSESTIRAAVAGELNGGEIRLLAHLITKHDNWRQAYFQALNVAFPSSQ